MSLLWPRRFGSEKPRSDHKAKQASSCAGSGSPLGCLTRLAHCARVLLCTLWYIGCCTCINVLLSLGSGFWLIRRELFYAVVAMGKRSFSTVIFSVTQILSNPSIRMHCEPDIDEQIRPQDDGSIQTHFPHRLVVISNHQIETDWIFIWWTAFTSGMHGYVHMLAKEAVRFFPCMYPATLSFGFAFLSRRWKIDEARLQHRLKQWSTRHPHPALSPMWLFIYPEGTTLSRRKRKASSIWADGRGVQDFKHLLMPRATGLLYCLQGLRGSVDWVYDCTVAYDGVVEGEYALEKFNLVSIFLRQSGPKKVNLYWRRYALNDIPTDTVEHFQAWLMERWKEKEAMLHSFYTTGHFLNESGSGDTRIDRHRLYHETGLNIGLNSCLGLGQVTFVFLIAALVLFGALTSASLRTMSYH